MQLRMCAITEIHNYEKEITMSTWTVADLVALTVQALDYDHYCEACGVVPLKDTNDKYCDGCTNAMLEDMAVREGEQDACDKGLY